MRTVPLPSTMPPSCCATCCLCLEPSSQTAAWGSIGKEASLYCVGDSCFSLFGPCLSGIAPGVYQQLTLDRPHGLYRDTNALNEYGFDLVS